MLSIKKIIFNILFFSVLFFSSQVFAITSNWQRTEGNEGKARFIYAGKTSGDSNNLLAGLEFSFEKDWHTYWKNSGDSGVPVAIDFSNSKNIEDIKIIWPAPKREVIYGVETFILGGDKVILPLIITPKNFNEPMELKLKASFAVCKDVCLFAEGKYEAKINPDYFNQNIKNEIEKFIAKTPKLNFNKDAEIKNIKADDSQIITEIKIKENLISKNADIFISEESKNFRFPKTKKVYYKNSEILKIFSPYETLVKGETLENKNLNFVFSNDEYSIEKNIENIQLEKSPSRKDSKEIKSKHSKSITIITAIIAALIGGLILNIMPCVLPVLSLKIFGMVKHGASDKKYIRKSFLFSTLGILFSFLLLAIGVVFLKQAGESVGWGIQFQEPYFIIFLCFILALFAANQFGLFEVLLPSKANDKINNLLDKSGDSSALGSFLTGAFATLLATPCTAPFLTTAVSFAFAGDNLTIFLIFFFMGLGLAMPYILIMIAPSLVKIFPKPGAWMLKVRIILGVLIYLTTYWLLYVLVNNAGYYVPIIVFVGIHMIFIFLWIAKIKNIYFVRVFIAIAWVIIVVLLMCHFVMTKENEVKQYHNEWIEFDEKKISEYVKKGRVVLVDVTADWCLTCKFNKLNTINPSMDFLKENKVILMRADFTKPSEKIHNFLVKNGRYAIPFNKIYGPKKPDGIILGELLDKKNLRKAVFDAIDSD
ncbi:MAG: protein-disulfide reductase DsbD family protein [Rickettsiales bacterium]|nr:protein-disulfide reductase DsbD family protein [Rickettsiales bacterium]